MANTGKIGFGKLRKVVDGGLYSGQPLDVNNELSSVSGLPQSVKDNIEGDPNYYPPVNNSAECQLDDPIYFQIPIIIKDNSPSNMCIGADIEEFSLYSTNLTGALEVGDIMYFLSDLGEYLPYNTDNVFLPNTWYEYHAYFGEYLIKYYLRLSPFTGQILAKIPCSDDHTNEEETRTYYRNNCTSPQNGSRWDVTIPAGTITGTSEIDVLDGVNAWFTANGQSQANTNGTCISPDETITVWVVTGSPCSGTRTSTNLYYKGADNKFYTDPARTILFTGTFFPSDNTINNYIIVVSGVAQDSINNSCPVSGTLRYDDMGTPSDISVFGTSLIAAYPDKGVILKYSTLSGTNPIGTIVAGELGKTALGPQSPGHWLNMPLLVEWRDDGDRFVVYSSGFYKTLKIFSKDGVYLAEGAVTGYDDQWNYNTPGDPVNGRYQVPTSSTSLVGLLTATDAALSNYWVPTALEYSTKPNIDGYDVIFMALWHKTASNENHFKLYATVPMPYEYLQGFALTSNVITSTGYADGGADLIRGIQVIKKTTLTSKSARFKVAVVAPRTKSKAGNDKYRFYDLSEMEVNINSIESTIFPGTYIPQISPQTFNDKGFYRINNRTNGVWKNNVKAELNFTSGALVVIIKSTTDSFWNILLRTAGLPTAGAVIGYVLTLVNFGSATFGWWVGPLASTTITPLGIVVAVLLIAAVIIFAPPAQKYIGGSALTFSFSGTSTTSIGYIAGSYSMSTWVENDIRKPRSIYLDAGNFGSLTLYSLRGNVVSYGNWDSNTKTGDIII